MAAPIAVQAAKDARAATAFRPRGQPEMPAVTQNAHCFGWFQPTISMYI